MSQLKHWKDWLASGERYIFISIFLKFLLHKCFWDFPMVYVSLEGIYLSSDCGYLFFYLKMCFVYFVIRFVLMRVCKWGFTGSNTWVSVGLLTLLDFPLQWTSFLMKPLPWLLHHTLRGSCWSLHGILVAILLLAQIKYSSNN